MTCYDLFFESITRSRRRERRPGFELLSHILLRYNIPARHLEARGKINRGDTGRNYRRGE
jgi:hypothetical protein